MSSQPGFFDLSHRYEALSKFGDPLERLKGLIDFESFRRLVEKELGFKRSSKGGRPPYDCILILKILILQTLYNLSDDQIEFQIKDRLSFMRFLSLGLEDRVPDAKTIWLYRERFKEKNLIDKIFKQFDEMLRSQGYLAMSGQIVDASIISAPRQHNTKSEKEAIKQGTLPKDWENHPSKLCQKDLDARWVVKYLAPKAPDTLPLVIPFYGYKNHIATDKRHRFIRQYHVTDASVYDGLVLPELLNKDNTCSKVWGDTAYRSQSNEEYMANNGFTSEVHRKKPKGKPMPIRTRQSNGRKSSVRCKVEHVFAHQKAHMGLFIRTIGIARAELKIGLANLVYNMKRFLFLEKRAALTG